LYISPDVGNPQVTIIINNIHLGILYNSQYGWSKTALPIWFVADNYCHKTVQNHNGTSSVQCSENTQYIFLQRHRAEIIDVMTSIHLLGTHLLLRYWQIFRLDAWALSVIATATWLAGWVAGWLAVTLRYCIKTV